jgi:hypothetical protein
LTNWIKIPMISPSSTRRPAREVGNADAGTQENERLVMSKVMWSGSGALLLLAALVSGCTDANGFAPTSTYEVKGRVVLRNGAPVTGGRIVFVPQEQPGLYATSPIGPDGSFELSTLKPGDGAAPGKYKVRVEPDLAAVAGRSGLRKIRYPARYSDEDSSGLFVTVKAESNQLDPIRLK